MQSHKITALLLASLFSLATHSQNVAINKAGNVANQATILDLGDASDSTLGFRMPNVYLRSAVSTLPLITPPDGIMVYNTNASMVGGNGKGFYYWSAAALQWYYVLNSNASAAVSLIDAITLTGAATSYTPSPGTHSCTVEIVGGGGGGGGCTATASNNSAAGGGGGSGGYSKFYILNPSGSYSLAAGAGGAGGAAGNNNGAAGGNTWFQVSLTTKYTAQGGAGGLGSPVNNGSTLGGVGGTIVITGSPSTTIASASGMPGGYSVCSVANGNTDDYNNSGQGGSSIYGGGGATVGPQANGLNGSPNTGSGGSGGVSAFGSGAYAGGNGAGGSIIITEFR